MDAIELVNAAIAGDRDATAAAFNAAIANKVSDALEVKKVEIASTLLGDTQEEVPNESENIETEVDGSGSEDSAESSTEE